MVETKIEVANAEALTATEEVLLQNNDISLSAIHDALDERIFEKIKNIEMAHEA
jgi:vacuolar-type H+-ATPase subunit F/Vma7